MNSAFGVSGSMSVGRMAYSHNCRETHTKNVDTALSSQNVTLVDRLAKYEGDVERYVNEKMAPVIERYNEGKKPSRQIKEPYTDYRARNKNLAGTPLCYEAVIQIGEHEGLGESFYKRFQEAVERGDTEAIERNKGLWTEAYKGILDKLRIDYPHIDVVGAWIHFDEPGGTPHMHVEYVPFGHPERGLPVQVSIGRALQNDGIERIQNRAEAKELGGYQIAKWYKAVQEDIIQPALAKFMEHFPNLNWERKEVQHGREHLDVETFKAVKNAEKRLEKAEIDLQEAKNAIRAKIGEYERYKGMSEKAKAELTETEQYRLLANSYYAGETQKLLKKSNLGEYEAQLTREAGEYAEQILEEQIEQEIDDIDDIGDR